MKIRDKLLIAFGLYIFLAAIMGFFTYKELQTITKRLAIVETADDITNTVLEVRRFEKNYLLFRDEESLKDFEDHLRILKKSTDDIKTEIIKEIGKDNYEKMKGSIYEYEKAFNTLISNFRLQEDIAKRVRSLGRRIENRMKDERKEIFLTVRKEEKNLMAFKNDAAYKNFEDAVTASNMRDDKDVRKYTGLVNDLFALYTQEMDFIDIIRSSAREIQSFTEDISKKERKDINSLLKSSMRLLLFAVLLIVIMGSIINIKLSRSIANPIKRLEERTKRIAGGDFSEHIDIKVKGNDEIASLVTSYNQMEDKIIDTMVSLELAIEKLHEKHAHLMEAEKLATLGKFSAGIAHEINNPLAIINEKAGLMKDLIEISEDFSNRERFLGILEAIFNSVDRCRGITHRILGFARRTDAVPETIKINDIINEVVGFIEKELLFKNIRLELNLKEGIPEFKSYRVQLQQVFLNLIKNAIDAVHDGGFIKISTDIKDKKALIVSVEDNGHGIPKDVLKHIFEPLFTTKERGKGTGLGLFIIYGIIKGLGGDITVKSEVDKGAVFTVEIPIETELVGGEKI